MLPKQHRLPLRTELKRIQKEGKLIQGELFSLLVSGRVHLGGGAKFDSREHLRGGARPPSRFGLIVSTKIHKKAVRRNRIRRLLVAAVGKMLPEIKPGFDGVFLVKKAILGKRLVVIEKEVRALFEKAGIVSLKDVPGS